MEPVSVKKSTCEKYFLRFNDPMCLWAEITIDEQGTFNAQSDNGNFQNIWRSHGRKSFKHFILELASDPHYFLKKVADKSYFDADATQKSWKEKILDWRQNDYLGKERTRKLWDDITELFEETSHQGDIERGRYHSDLFDDVECDCEDFELVMTYGPGAKHFAKAIMPEFAKIIKAELDGENL